MRTPSFLARTPYDAPNRSGFDMPFENMITGRCGQLIPVLCKQIIPNETIDLSIMFEAELPPMVSNWFGRVDLIFEAFFCPMSLLWKGWENFAMHPTANPVYPEGTPLALKPRQLPRIRIPFADEDANGTPYPDRGRGSLTDFLGYKFDGGNTAQFGEYDDVQVLRYLCYHRIYDDWYRNTIIQSPVFAEPRFGISSSSSSGANIIPLAASLPFVSAVNPDGSTAIISSSYLLADGSNIFDLRQRNFNLDYFTAATPQPQAGNASSIVFDVSVDPETGDGAGEISIAAIRQSNAIQLWMERNNLAGYDYADQVKAQYGVYPDNRLLRKPMYLGRYIEPVYNRSVFQTAQSYSNGQGENPFSRAIGNGVGNKFGASAANGRGNLFRNFKATDHGYLMVMCSLRPHAYYSTGVDRDFRRLEIGDIAFPLLSSVGDQAIYQSELTGAPTDSVFGYIDQYADYKCCVDEVHGLLVDGGSLDAFVLQRGFDPQYPVTISNNFLQIPLDYLDQVKQVKSDVIPVDFWASIFFDFKKVSPLPVHSVPTLGNLGNTHKEYMRRGGSRL